MRYLILLIGTVMMAFGTVKAQTMNWMTIEEAVMANQKAPKKIMIDVYTDWCGWCKVMDRVTFSNPVIVEYVNQKYYPVKFNAEQKDSVVIGSKVYNFVPSGRKGYHELAAALMGGKMSYPTVVFLDETLTSIHVQKGKTDPKPFDKLLKFIGENHYKNDSLNWETWVSNYKSPFDEE